MVMSYLDSAGGLSEYQDCWGSNQAGAVSRDRSETAGAVSAFPNMLCLSRRRCTDDGIRIASRYFATVRRAMSIPEPRSPFHDAVIGQDG